MISMNLLVRALALAAGIVGLASCGGGGGGDAPVAATTYPLQAAYRASFIAGSSTNYTVSGSCLGTASEVDAPAVPATFEGVAGFSSSNTFTLNLSNCTPATTVSTGADYVDASYTPIGSVSDGEEYGRISGTPTPLPASVKVGDSGSIGTLQLYTDSSKTTATGTRVLSYVIEADTGSSAIVNIVGRDYDLNGQLLSTQQSRYRILTDGTITPVSIDIVAGALHLVLTKV